MHKYLFDVMKINTYTHNPYTVPILDCTLISMNIFLTTQKNFLS